VALALLASLRLNMALRIEAPIDSAADTALMDLSALGAHVDRCNGLRGPMFGLHGSYHRVEEIVS
jgi:hypothetical protein